MNRRLAGWILGVALAPSAWLVGVAMPNEPGFSFGLPSALGCSGGGSVAPRPDGWTWLKPSMMSLTYRTHVPVATDGFFVIDAETLNLNAEAARDSLRVDVVDGSGQEVRGEVALLIERQPGWYLFGWTAKEPLAIGSSLTATLSASPATSENVGGEFPLVVEGEPTQLSNPEVTFEAWRDFYHGVGEPASCTAPVPCGGPQSTGFPSLVEKQLAATAMWRLPKIVGGIAWSATIEGSETARLVTTYDDVLLATGDEPSFALAQLAFPLDAESRCFVVALEDLRSGNVNRSEVCATPAATDGVETDSSAISCPAPPNAELTEVWCQFNAHKEHPDCLPPATEVPPTGEPETPPSEQPEGRATTRTSKGCSVSGARGTGGFATLLALAALGVWRRRRSAISRRSAE